VLGIAGQALRWTDGLPSRLSEQALQYANASKWRPELMACITDDKSPADTPFCRYGIARCASATVGVGRQSCHGVDPGAGRKRPPVRGQCHAGQFGRLFAACKG
jgi:hypothetical protein